MPMLRLRWDLLLGVDPCRMNVKQKSFLETLIFLFFFKFVQDLGEVCSDSLFKHSGVEH